MEDRELQRRIDARRYPTISGTLTTLEPDDTAGSYRAAGTVSFRGVEPEVDVAVDITATREQAMHEPGMCAPIAAAVELELLAVRAGCPACGDAWEAG